MTKTMRMHEEDELGHVDVLEDEEREEIDDERSA